MSRKYLCCVQREKGREPCASATTANRFTNVVTIGSFSLAGLSSRSSPLETRADLRIPLRIHPYFPDFPKRASTNLREIEKLRANVISFSLSLSLSSPFSLFSRMVDKRRQVSFFRETWQTYFHSIPHRRPPVKSQLCRLIAIV